MSTCGREVIARVGGDTDVRVGFQHDKKSIMISSFGLPADNMHCLVQ